INLSDMKRNDEALTDLNNELNRRIEKFGEESEQTVIALNLVAQFQYYYEGNYADALVSYSQLLSLLSENDDRYLEALRMMSDIYSFDHAYNESVTWSEKAIELQKKRNIQTYSEY